MGEGVVEGGGGASHPALAFRETSASSFSLLHSRSFAEGENAC